MAALIYQRTSKVENQRNSLIYSDFRRAFSFCYMLRVWAIIGSVVVLKQSLDISSLLTHTEYNKFYKTTYVDSEETDQSAPMCSLINVFAVWSSVSLMLDYR